MPDHAQSAPWLDREEQVAWRTFLFGITRVIEELSQVLEQDPEIDLTLNEYEILVRLSECEGQRVRMSDLADQVVHSRSRLTHTIARLEKRGLVERVRCADDGRGREAVLSAGGLALLERAAPRHVASVRAMLLDPLGREDFLRLGALMARTLPQGSQVLPASLLTSAP